VDHKGSLENLEREDLRVLLVRLEHMYVTHTGVLIYNRPCMYFVIRLWYVVKILIVSTNIKNMKRKRKRWTWISTQ